MNGSDTNLNIFDSIESQSEKSNLSHSLPKLSEAQRVKINYIVDLLCVNKSDYRFYHILVDDALETPIADEILKHLSACITAGLLTNK